MAYNRIVISSGHGLKVRGASGILDEVDEARLTTEALADALRARGVDVVVFHDNTSTSQSQNLNTIVAAHNKEVRDLDVSVHFNAYEQKPGPMGTEVLYKTQQNLAADLSLAIAKAGQLINRGAKKRTDLAFLNGTAMPAVLLEVCFVDSEADADLYRDNFTDIVEALADELGGGMTDELEPVPPASADFHAVGPCSHFGGPDDTGVSKSEGLAFIYKKMEAPHLFLPDNTPGTEGCGLARSLNPFVHYIACRWDYNRTPKPTLLENVAFVKALSTGIAMAAFPADWGPHESTGRIADLSPGLMADLGITTDDEVEVIYPWKGETS